MIVQLYYLLESIFYYIDYSTYKLYISINTETALKLFYNNLPRTYMYIKLNLSSLKRIQCRPYMELEFSVGNGPYSMPPYAI